MPPRVVLAVVGVSLAACLSLTAEAPVANAESRTAVFGLEPAAVYERVHHGVVEVFVYVYDYDLGYYPQVGRGSGFVYGPGLVLTAAHVVDAAVANPSGYVYVNFDPGYKSGEWAGVVVHDFGADVAVLDVDIAYAPEYNWLPGLYARESPGGGMYGGNVRGLYALEHPLPIRSTGVSMGDWVVALGYPSDRLTMKVGIVSANETRVRESTVPSLTDRSVVDVDGSVRQLGEIIRPFLTDANLGPGSSGSPVFDMRGEVVGMTIAGYDDEHLSVVLPIHSVLRVVESLHSTSSHTGLPALARDAVTEYVSLDGAIQLEKTTIPMHVPADNQFPWGHVRGTIHNPAEGYDVVIVMYQDDMVVHLAQVGVQEDGTYEYRFRALDVKDGQTTRIFAGDYRVVVSKVVTVTTAER